MDFERCLEGLVKLVSWISLLPPSLLLPDATNHMLTIRLGSWYKLNTTLCTLHTRREAERLCKSFLGDNAPPKLPENFAFEVRKTET